MYDLKILNSEDSTQIKKSILLFQNVLGYSESQAKKMVKYSSPQIASNLTAEQVKIIAQPFVNYDLRIYACDAGTNNFVPFKDCCGDLNKQSPEEHYYDEPIIGWKHLVDLKQMKSANSIPYSEKKESLLKLFMILILITICTYIILINQEDGSVLAKVSAVILLIELLFSIVTIVYYNICNAKDKNMTASSYLNNRFTNTTSETKEVFHINNTNRNIVECPYCHARNTTKITTTAKAVNTAMFGVLGQKRKHQWHCNNCKSDF